MEFAINVEETKEETSDTGLAVAIMLTILYSVYILANIQIH